MSHAKNRFLFSLCFLCLWAWFAPGVAWGQVRYEEHSQELGVDFVHRHFGTGLKYMPENMGGGVAVFDANGDGRLDLYFVQGAPVEGWAAREGLEPVGNQLFVQQADGRFVDGTLAAGVGDTGVGMGAVVGDIDADGDLDLYVTNYGRNVLYRNRGDGTFEDVTAAAGADCPLWSTSAGFFDADGDGDLDLYVVNYLDFSLEHHRFCGEARKQLRSYCHPDVYDGQRDVLYLNDGRGRFQEAGPEAGIPGGSGAKGLGVAFADLNGDGHTDIYVANDSTNNFLLLGDGQGHFQEKALLSGVAVNGLGQPEASMGIELADFDGNGLLDIFLTHLDQETNTLYQNLGRGLFLDATASSGLAAPSLEHVGFGTLALDPDRDGDLDLFVLNGHILDNIQLFDPSRRHAQPAQWFENRGGRFVERSAVLGLAEPLVGRSAASGDLDGDGDLDLVLTQNGGPAKILLNQSQVSGSWLALQLQGKASNPHGFGAHVEILVEGKRWVREVRSPNGYLSQSALGLWWGLGSSKKVQELRVRWPSGREDRLRDVSVGQVLSLVEGSHQTDTETP